MLEGQQRRRMSGGVFQPRDGARRRAHPLRDLSLDQTGIDASGEEVPAYAVIGRIGDHAPADHAWIG